MVTKNITEQRAEVRIFAGNDPAHTATGSSGISSATPALTPLMLDEASGKPNPHRGGTSRAKGGTGARGSSGAEG